MRITSWGRDWCWSLVLVRRLVFIRYGFNSAPRSQQTPAHILFVSAFEPKSCAHWFPLELKESIATHIVLHAVFIRYRVISFWAETKVRKHHFIRNDGSFIRLSLDIPHAHHRSFTEMKSCQKNLLASIRGDLSQQKEISFKIQTLPSD